MLDGAPPVRLFEALASRQSTGSVAARGLAPVELEVQMAKAFEALQRADMKSFLTLILLERAGLVHMRGDADGMARDLAEARRLFAEMGVTGWDTYARSIEA